LTGAVIKRSTPADLTFHLSCCCRDFVDAFANHFDYLFGAVITDNRITLADLTLHLFNCCRDFVDAFANHSDYLFGAVITDNRILLLISPFTFSTAAGTLLTRLPTTLTTSLVLSSRRSLMLSLPFTYFNCCRDFVDAFANHFDYLFGAVIT
jgi:hypothetical protein